MTALMTRFDAYGRYLTLLEKQLQALDGEDMELFNGLADQRDVLAAAVDQLAPASQDGRVAELLRRCAEADERLRARLRALRDEARDHLRDMDARRPKLAPYLAAQTGGRLDRLS